MFGVISVVAAVLLALPGTAQTADVAMVTDAQGPGRFERAGASGAVEVLAGFEADTRLALGEGARVTLVYLGSGVEYVFAGPADVVLGPAAPVSRSGEPPERRDLLVGQATDLATFGRASYVQAAIALRGVGASGVLLSPRDTAVATFRPGFRWKPIEGARGYRFWLSMESGEILHERALPAGATAHRLPESFELEPGGRYLWGVLPDLGEQPAYPSEARFHVLDRESLAEVGRRRLPERPSVSDRVIHAAFLERYGLLEEAHVHWQALAREHPDQPRLRKKAQSRGKK
jgi:hypothetical protein